MIVVDNSVLIEVLLAADPGTVAARRLAPGDLAAPEVIDLEALHALRGLVRGGKLDEREGERLVLEVARFPIERYPHGPFLPRIWELRHNLTAYDAAYVALAEELDVTLVTGDARLASAPGIRCSVEVLR